MKNFRVRALAAAVPASAASPSEIARLDQNSQKTIGELNDLLNEATDNTRKTCASGQAAAWVSDKRAHARPGERFPDAPDMCVATLEGVAQGQRLLVYYKDLLTAVGGDPAMHAAFPRSVGAAVTGGAGKVPIGNNKAAAVTPALAFDAGFTVAYRAKDASKAGAGDADTLKSLTDACLNQRQDAGTCFSIGYVYGGKAIAAGR